MQTILDRVQYILDPFRCSFAVPTPTCNRRGLPRRPPPDLPLELWLEIFEFATYVHRSVTIKPLPPFTIKHTSTNVMGANTPALALYTKLALVLVCKSWRRLALPMLYEHLVIRSPARASAILQVLERGSPFESSVQSNHTPIYGHWTRHIEIFTYTRGSGSTHHLQVLCRIFRRCPNLHMLSCTWTHPLPVEFLNAVSQICGNSLEGLYWNEERLYPLPNFNTSTTPDFLASFKSLQVLDIRHFIGREDSFNCIEQNGPRPTLPFVQDLIISTHPRSLSAATVLSLPKLRNLTIKTPIPDNTDHVQLAPFLKAHGQSLLTVDLPSPSPDSEPEPDTSMVRRTAKHIYPDIFLQPDICPNLVSLTFPITSPPLAPHVHPTLRRIGLRGVKADSLYPDRSSSAKSHLLAMTSARYPNLILVQTVGFLVDADIDGLIRDIFIWWVEKFERQGIDFLDGEGVLWAYMDSDEIQESKRIPSFAEKQVKGDGRPKEEGPSIVKKC